MINQSLYDYLFEIESLPLELKDGRIRNELIHYLNSKINVSLHSHRQLLLSAGMVSDRIYFVEKGLVRSYVIENLLQKENTTSFWGDHSMITDVASFIQRTPSNVYLEAMPNTILLSLSHQQLMDIIDNFPFTHIFLGCLMSVDTIYNNKRFYNLKNLTAWERYQEMLKNYPKIEQKVSKEIISSFLGVTPQYLSKMIKANR